MGDNDVQQLLKQLQTITDVEERRMLIRKCIFYLTLGVDVSSLFVEMIKAIHTNDFVQKKLIYQYLAQFARQNETNAQILLLTVNSFQKDCTMQTNPKIRGLALRTLTVLCVSGLLEHIIPLLLRGLTDPSAYVRKIAVIGCARIAKVISSKQLKELRIVDSLYEMLRDKDPLVVSNCVLALNEILPQGIVLNWAIVVHLINRMADFDSTSKCSVLKQLAKFQPNEEQKFEIMNSLDSLLENISSAVVLTTISLFLKLVQNDKSLHNQVLERIKAPLIAVYTLECGNHIFRFHCLRLMTQISKLNPSLFSAEWRSFSCLHFDPPFVMHAKLSLLSFLKFDESEIISFLKELSQFARNPQCADDACELICEISQQFSTTKGISEFAIDILFELMDSSSKLADSVLSVCASRMISSIYFQTILKDRNLLSISLFQRLESENAKCMLIWLLGKCCAEISDSPYILESILQHGFQEFSSDLQLSLLNACVSCFLERPAETKPVLSFLFQKCFGEGNHFLEQIVQDSILRTYKLLSSSNLNELRTILNENVGKPKTILRKENEMNFELLALKFDGFSITTMITQSKE